MLLCLPVFNDLSKVFTFEFDVMKIVAMGLGVLLVVLGILTPKVKPNPFFGIRTSWTLESKKVWIGTHKLGGTAFVWLGIAGIALSIFLNGLFALVLVFVGLIATTVVLAVFSYKLFKKEQAGELTES